MVTQRASPTGIIGVRGLKNLGGRVQEEYLTALKSWAKESKLYLEMRDDLVVGTLLDALKLPLLAAEFDVTPAGDSEADGRAQTFLWDNLNRMNRQSWRSHVSDMLEFLDFGFAIGELVLEKREDGRLWLSNIEPLGQETLYRWDFDERDAAQTFVQTDPDTGKTISIPLSKCILASFRGRKGNPQGKSLLRSLYRPWRFLRDLENMEAIGVERDVGGMPVVKLPEGVTNSADLTTVKDFLKGLRQDEELYGILPFGFELSAYGGGNKMYDVGAIIERKKKEILMRLFAQFLMLGMDKVGTQALVKGSHDFFYLGLIAIQQMLLEIWQQQLVPYLFEFNQFPGMTDYPKITWADPGKVDIKALLDAYTQGVNSKLLTPLREDEEAIRPMMGLPDLPEGEGEGNRDVETVPPQGLF